MTVKPVFSDKNAEQVFGADGRTVIVRREESADHTMHRYRMRVRVNGWTLSAIWTQTESKEAWCTAWQPPALPDSLLGSEEALEPIGVPDFKRALAAAEENDEDALIEALTGGA